MSKTFENLTILGSPHEDESNDRSRVESARQLGVAAISPGR